MIVTLTTTEIPTGAVADLLGKKRTLLLAFFLGSFGHFVMAFAPSLFVLGISIVIMTIGSAFYSGTMEALVFDSMKVEGKEGRYDKVISNMHSVQNISLAVSGLIGGFMYAVSVGLPFFAVGVVNAMGLILVLFLKEPEIDTEKFSLKNYMEQTKYGFYQLFKDDRIRRVSISLLTMAFFSVIAYEMLNDVLFVEYGFNAKQLGLLAAISSLVGAVASQITPILTKRLTRIKVAIFVGFLISVSFVFSPFVGMLIGGVFVIFRYSLQVMYDNLTSIIVNKNTESKYRATTLSTYNMIKSIPYVLTAYFIGSLMDVWSAKYFAFILGVLLLCLIVVQPLIFRYKSGPDERNR